MKISITRKESDLLQSYETQIRQAMRDFQVALGAIKAAHDVEIPEGATFQRVEREALVFTDPQEQDESDS